MITYRQHIVSLVAVFLALAVGVVLGGGPLSDIGRKAPTASEVRADNRDAEQSAAFVDEFATGAAERLYGNRLADRGVSLVTMPGADDETVSALAREVESAGGFISTTYAVLPAMVRVSGKSLVDTLGSQLRPQLDPAAVDRDASTYVRAGQLLGLVVSSPRLAEKDSLAVGQSLAGADLMDVPDPAYRAPLVLVVLGDEVDDAIVTGLLTGLAARSFAVVAVGDTASASAGDLAALRGAPEAETVATVDGADRPLGRVSAVLALIRSLKIRGGAFGAAGADGPVPLG